MCTIRAVAVVAVTFLNDKESGMLCTSFGLMCIESRSTSSSWHMFETIMIIYSPLATYTAFIHPATARILSVLSS
jgi:hypothetical protein